MRFEIGDRVEFINSSGYKQRIEVGTIVEKNYYIKATTYLVKLDNCPEEFKTMHEAQGGLIFYAGELKKYEDCKK